MRQGRIYGFAAGCAICLMVLAAGCAQPAKQAGKPEPENQKVIEKQVKIEEVVKPEVKPQETIKVEVKPEVKPQEQQSAVQLALKFAANDSTTYKVITEIEKSVKWEGPLPKEPFAFKGGVTGNKVEMTFTQQIQSVDDKGNAVAQIAIKELKYLGKVKDNVVMDFDSTREKDANSPLHKLIGQSYTIEISPVGQVLRVIDAAQAKGAVAGDTAAGKTALALLAPDVIAERHAIPGLPAADKNQVRTGDNWSSIKTYSFDMMGAKSYERVYTLKEVKEENNRKVAITEMKAIPSTEKAEELHKEQAIGLFSKMFDNTETYTGQFKLNLDSGKIEECIEKLQTEWVVVDPKPEEGKEPAALRMTATRLYSIEKTD